MQHLRDGFATGRWRGHLPGVLRLAKELGVSKGTVRTALALLEAEGALRSSKAGKRREIVLQRNAGAGSRKLRVAILLYQKLEHDDAQTQELILSIKFRVEAAGHVCLIGEQSIVSLGNKLARVTQFVNATQADAWIVCAGTRDVLEWFARQETNVLAIGGRALGLPVAWTRSDVDRAMGDTVNALVKSGHRRIILICSSVWRHPKPSLAAQGFLDHLRHHGVTVSDYNLPEWDETPEGFGKLMKSLFFATPPTALVTAEPRYCVAALTALAGRGIMVPRDLSLVNIIPDPAFSLHRPIIAGFEWPIPAHIDRTVRWVEAVARGKADREVTVFHAKFIPGGTIARAKR